MRRLLAMTGALALLVTTPAVTVAKTSMPVWEPCQPDAVELCAHLDVPLSWAKPEGPRTKLFVARVPARDQANKLGTLFFNPGGPGGAAGSIFAAGLADGFFPTLRDRYDLVGFDPRGTGQSSQLDCGFVIAPGTPAFPKTQAEYDAMVRASRATGERCLRRHGDLMRNLDTRTAARDLDAIRAVLGQAKVSYIGLSYGSLLGATYAELFPQRVDRMVLDGIVNHAEGSRWWMLNEARAMEDGFNRFAKWCSTDTSCALHGQDVGKLWDQVVAAADKKPLPSEAGPVNGDQLRMALPTMLPSAALFANVWADLADALAKAAKGDGNGFVGRSMIGNPESAYAAVSCMDMPGELKGFADARARQTMAKAVAPRTGAAVEAWAMAVACAGWPIKPSNPWHYSRITGVPPILITSTRHDPSTPLISARGLQRRIPRSHLLIAETYGHTTWLNAPCARDHISDYLLTGKLPSVRSC